MSTLKVYVETDCTFEFQGKSFTSGGAVVAPDYAIGYPKFEREYIGAAGIMDDWHGNKLGECRITGKWSTPRSFISSYYFQIEATINGVKYTGRSAGNGMIWKGKRSKRQ